MEVTLPLGYRVGATYCGLKRSPKSFDLAIIASDFDATVAGVYTQNLVRAACVELDVSRTPTSRGRAVVINSGNANACTGQQGMENARRMAAETAACIGVEESQVLVLSTGIIGEQLPMEKISAGIRSAAKQLDTSGQSIQNVARAMMTTDRHPKMAGRTIDVEGKQVHLLGLAKGAGMIGPNMATMLAVILTDAGLEPELAQQLLREAVDKTFNCISVEGHTSTNDSVLLFANGQAGVTINNQNSIVFQEALLDLCTELARAIPADGEGATHLITIHVNGCHNEAEAKTIARTVANSPLVKTAIAGADPNWGRIVSAAGYSGVQFDPNKVSLKVNGYLLFAGGSPVQFDSAVVSAAIRESFETTIELDFALGNASATFWTSDLTVEYVRINSLYHT